MTKAFTMIMILSYILCSCSETSKNQTSDKKEEIKDTIIISEEILNSTTSDPEILNSNIFKKFENNSFTKNELKKNDTLNLFISYKNAMKNLISKLELDIIIKNKYCHISKINNYNFKIFIDSLYNESILEMIICLSPKKHYIITEEKFDSKNQIKFNAFSKSYYNLEYKEFYKVGEKMVLYHWNNKVEND